MKNIQDTEARAGLTPQWHGRRRGGQLALLVATLTLGFAAQAQVTTPTAGAGLSCSGDLPAPVALGVVVGKSTLLKLSAPIVRRTLGNEEVVQARQLGPQTVYLLGMKVGTTNMILQDKAGKCVLVDVDVGVDPAALQAKLQQLLPGEKNIKVSSAAGSLMLSGEVSDAYKAERAMALAAAYAGAEERGGGAEKVINMLTVAAPHQVMLEVKVAEVSKNLIDKLGGAYGVIGSDSHWRYGVLSNFVNGSLGGKLSGTSQSGKANFALEAEKKDGLIKVLAEPTIMAISGQEGAFLAGGKIFIPVPSYGAGGVSNVTLEEREFGVGIRFTPTVLEGGLINLRVAPEVSELASEGVSVSSGSSASVLPLITTRRAATTVQLYDGQSFAIGGLIKNNVTQNIAAFPFLGEIPVLGTLFRSSSFQTDRSELLIVVTPRLVKPLPPDYALPTDSFVEPTRSEFFLGGQMEGGREFPPASFQPDGSDNTPADGPRGFEVK